jgi:membrane associated rhomboid family serine protease
MSTTPTTTCFRHPDRETGRRCTRCGRPACPDCLREASVGAQCVECVNAGATPPLERLRRRVRGERMFATKAIIAITVVAFVATGMHATTSLWLYGPDVHNGDWWRLFTVALVHANLLHIFFNMLVLWQVGLMLEPGAGKLRFSTLYVVSVLAGSAGALIAAPHDPSVGASGGVVGVAAACALVMHRQGARFWETGFGPLLLVVVFVEPFIVGNVSEGGHVGGIIGGVLATEAMIQARKIDKPWLGYVGALVVGVAAIVAAFAAAPS